MIGDIVGCLSPVGMCIVFGPPRQPHQCQPPDSPVQLTIKSSRNGEPAPPREKISGLPQSLLANFRLTIGISLQPLKLGLLASDLFNLRGF